MLPIFAVVARKLVLIDGIYVHHIAESLAEALLTVVIDAVAHHRLALVAEHGAVHQYRLFLTGVIVTLLGVYSAIARGDVRRPHDVGDGVGIVVVECIRSQVELWRLHLHVVVEHRHLGLGIILSPVGGQCSPPVDHLTSLEEIGVVVEAVEVEGVGIECCVTVLEHHVVARPCHLLVAVVVGIVGEQ